MLEGDVEIGQDLALRHERDDLIDMRVGIDVVQADPGAELAELLGEVEEARANLAILPQARLILQVDAVGAGVLRDDQDLLHAGFDQLSASRSTSPAGRLTRSPRSFGMMQNEQRLLQPSEIFR